MQRLPVAYPRFLFTMEVQIVLVPYDSGQRGVRMGAAPEHLRASGLEAYLAAQGHSVALEVVESAGIWHAETQTAFELMRLLAKRVYAARAAGRFPLVLSGNCNAAVGVIAGLGASAGVLWFDAHGDFDTPETTTSGFLDGMGLAIVAGRCWRQMTASMENFHPVPESSIVLLGARELDLSEAAALMDSGITRLSVSEARERIMLLLDVIVSRAEQFYVHLDLDALDTTVGRANTYAAPGGFSLVDLISLLSKIANRLPVSALTVSAYDPSCDKTGTVQEAAFAAVASLLSVVDARSNGAHQTAN
jgi:Arginase/agmatinase/formimionoglutamate hydrolase, arginase family